MTMRRIDQYVTFMLIGIGLWEEEWRVDLGVLRLVVSPAGIPFNTFGRFYFDLTIYEE